MSNMNNTFGELNIDNFKKELEKSDTVLIDIRTKEEWEKFWIIPGTDKFIVYGHPLFEYQIEKLDKSKSYLLYCWHWNRSKFAMEIMKEKWFIFVKDLAGWIDKWTKAGEKIKEKL